jgi:hypothetical protein
MCQNIELFGTQLERKQAMSKGWEYELCCFDVAVG